MKRDAEDAVTQEIRAMAAAGETPLHAVVFSSMAVILKLRERCIDNVSPNSVGRGLRNLGAHRIGQVMKPGTQKRGATVWTFAHPRKFKAMSPRKLFEAWTQQAPLDRSEGTVLPFDTQQKTAR